MPETAPKPPLVNQALLTVALAVLPVVLVLILLLEQAIRPRDGLLLLAAIVVGGFAVSRWQDTRRHRAVALAEETMQRQQRQAQDRLSGQASAADAMLDALPDPVLLLDSARRVRRANDAAEDLLGSALVGEDLSLSLRHPAVLDAVSEVLAGAGTQRALDITLPLTPPREFSARVVALPSAADGLAAVLTLHDLTAIHRAERMRADFVANASHELRTPLATLVGFIETLQGPAKDDAVARERFLGIMADQAGRMARLIRDLLSLSQIELNEHLPPRQPVDLGRILAGVVDTLQLEASRAGASIVVDIAADLPQVAGDADELTQVFQNLIDNALKYGGKGQVRVAATTRGAQAVSVAVTDHGPGIPREHLPRLTERFYRVDSARSRALGGTGLGLAIVKHIVSRHRGALTIDSTLGRGATFTVSLPALAREAAA